MCGNHQYRGDRVSAYAHVSHASLSPEMTDRTTLSRFDCGISAPIGPDAAAGVHARNRGQPA